MCRLGNYSEANYRTAQRFGDMGVAAFFWLISFKKVTACPVAAK